MINITKFKEEIEPYLKEFEIKYRFFEEGDFGELNQVEFNSKEKGGGIDFWSSGWLGVLLVDYIHGKELINVFLEPHQIKEKQGIFEELKEILK